MMDSGRATRCGTYAGYAIHKKHAELACDACLRANAVYMKQWRARSGRTKTARVPYLVLGTLLMAAPSRIAKWATAQLGDAVAANARRVWREQRREGGR